MSKGEFPLVAFIHVPKAAGTSFREWLGNQFGNIMWHCEPDLGDRGPDFGEHFAKYGISGFQGYPAIGGHFPGDAPFVQSLPQSTIVCAMVREPVDRAISLYGFIRRTEGHPLHSQLCDLSLLESVSTPYFRSEIDNGQIRYILGSGEINVRQILVCQLHEEHLLREELALLSGQPAVAIHRQNVSPQGYRTEIEAQPGFEEAAALIAQINEREMAFVRSIRHMQYISNFALPEEARPVGLTDSVNVQSNVSDQDCDARTEAEPRPSAAASGE